jgi:hypothetical protein
MQTIVVNNWVTQSAATSSAMTTAHKVGLVSYWALNEASGTRADSHSTNDLADNNTVTQGAGHHEANSADFELSNAEFLSHADNAALSGGTGSFSWSLWAKLESKAASQYLVLKNQTWFSAVDYCIRYNASLDRFQFMGSAGTGASNYFILSADNFGAVSTATWYHVACVYDGVNALIYINGGTADTEAHTAGTANGSTPLNIGAYQQDGNGPRDEYFDGLMESVGFWSRALTSTEVSELAAGLTYS